MHKRTDSQTIPKQITSSSKPVQMKTNVLPTRKMEPRSLRARIKKTRVIQLIVLSSAVEMTCVIITLETTNKWSAGCGCCYMCHAYTRCLSRENSTS